MRVPAGATLAVLGRNGAGKSTLLRILSTLLRPHAGEVLVFGEPLPRRAFAVRGRLGLLAHDPLLYNDLTGRENLIYHARLHDVRRERVEQLLAAVGMERRAEEPVRLLSRRNGAAAGDVPGGAAPSPSCSCSTSRGRTSTRARASWSSR